MTQIPYVELKQPSAATRGGALFLISRTEVYLKRTAVVQCKITFTLILTMVSPAPPRGVYSPVVAFFKEDETLDLIALEAHVERLAQAGVAGLVIQGSNGEAPHLIHSERQEVIGTASRVLKEHGKDTAVIIAGCGAQSTRETVQLCNEAKESGADYALVLSPSYWSEFVFKVKTRREC